MDTDINIIQDLRFKIQDLRFKIQYVKGKYSGLYLRFILYPYCLFAFSLLISLKLILPNKNLRITGAEKYEHNLLYTLIIFEKIPDRF